MTWSQHRMLKGKPLMPELDDDKSASLGSGRGINRGPDAQDDPITNPNGVYSGMTRRMAATNGEHVTMQGRPKDLRNVGRLPFGNDKSGSRHTS
jgi:hypothetical protein